MKIIKTTAFTAETRAPQSEQDGEMAVTKTATIHSSSSKKPTPDALPIPPDEEMQDEAQEGRLNWVRRHWYDAAKKPSPRKPIIP